MSKDELQRTHNEEDVQISQLAMLPHKDGSYTSSEVLQVVSQWPTRTHYNVFYVEPSQKEVQVSTGLFLGQNKNGDFIARFNPDLGSFTEKVDCTDKFEVRAIVPIIGPVKCDKRVRHDDDDIPFNDRREDMLEKLQLIKDAFQSSATSAGVQLFLESYDELQEFVKK